MLSWARALTTAFALCAGLASAAGCDGCDGCRGLAKQMTARPDDETAKLAVTKELRTRADVATTMCGVPASGIAIDEITVEQSKLDIPGFGKATIKGQPLAEKDAGPIDLTKVAVCAGVIHFGMSGKADAEGKVTAWKIYSFDLWEVSTEGVKWERPPSKGGGHD